MISVDRLSDLQPSHLDALVSASIPEGPTIEYKVHFPAGTPELRKISVTVCAFANTAGGDILFGVKETNGTPAMTGVELSDVDQAKLTLTSSMNYGIEPKIPHFEIGAVAISTGRYVVALRVSPSWAMPHRVLGEGHFYTRGPASNQQMDIAQIRRSFLRAEIIGEEIRAEHARRVDEIASGSPLIPMLDGPKIVVHGFSLSAKLAHLRLETNVLRQAVTNFAPIRATSGYSGPRVCLEGAYTRQAAAGHTGAYTLLTRDYGIEAVANAQALNAPDGQKTILASQYETGVRTTIDGYLGMLRALGAQSPVILFVALTEISGYRFKPNTNESSDFFDAPFRRGNILLPSIEIADLSTPAREIVPQIYEMIGNAFGVE